MKTILLFIALTLSIYPQGMIVIDSSQVDNVKGRYGIYSEIQPIKIFDGKFIVPTACLEDKDLIQAKDKLLTAQSNGQTVTIKDLPASGTIYKDSLYLSSEGLVKCRQTHQRTIYKPSETPALFSFFRENSDTLQWIPNEEVKAGWKRIYNGVTYICLQSHMTLENWTPTNTLGVLWQAEAPPTSEWTVGVAYKVGDIVTYQGNTYQCLQSHTSILGWSPVATLNVLWKRL